MRWTPTTVASLAALAYLAGRVSVRARVVPHAEGQDIQPLPATMELIADRTSGGPARQELTADALDGKAFQIFSAATVVLGLGAFAARDFTPLATGFYGAAIAAY